MRMLVVPVWPLLLIAFAACSGERAAPAGEPADPTARSEVVATTGSNAATHRLRAGAGAPSECLHDEATHIAERYRWAKPPRALGDESRAWLEGREAPSGWRHPGRLGAQRAVPVPGGDPRCFNGGCEPRGPSAQKRALRDHERRVNPYPR